jgi:hypothetical protein
MPIKQAMTNQRVPVKIWTASSLDVITRNRGFWTMISSISLRYIAATCYLLNTGNLLKCREEIQCRTVEFLSKQIVMVLHTLNIPCTPLRNAIM